MLRSPVPATVIARSLALLLLAAPGCASDTVAPDRGMEDVRLTAELSTATLTADDTASLIVRVHNTGTREVRFAVQSRCQVTIRIRDVASRQDVFTSGGGWQCAGVLSGATIAAQGARALPVLLHAVSPLPGHIHGVHLESGEYEVVARLTTAQGEIDSAPLRFGAH